MIAMKYVVNKVIETTEEVDGVTRDDILEAFPGLKLSTLSSWFRLGRLPRALGYFRTKKGRVSVYPTETIDIIKDKVKVSYRMKSE